MDREVAVAPDAPLGIDAAVVTVDAPVVLEDAAVADAQAEAPPAAPLYTVTEALEDIGAGPLVLVGTGPWFGNFSIPACAYRNSRVFVVYVYCTAKEQPALGLVVLSPTRGRLRIYAEADTPISTLARAAYQTFRAESEPPFVAEPLSLEMSYAELVAWDERRYNAHVGACWAGDAEDCSRHLVGRLPAWVVSATPFLAEPPDAWYALAKDLHARAIRDSRKKPAR